MFKPLVLLSVFIVNSFFYEGNKLLPVPSQKSLKSQSNQSIIFIGDTQRTSGLEFWRENNEGIAKTIMKEIASEKPSFVVHLGDMVFQGSSAGSWKNFLDDAEDIRKNKIPIYPVLGNHEYFGRDQDAFNNLISHFPFFIEKSWYSVKASFSNKTVGIILLNSNFSGLTKEQNGEQLKWYSNELQKFQSDTTISFIIAGAHHPPFTNSRAVSDDKDVQNYFVKPFLAISKARIFFSGHCHSYEHFVKDGKHFIVSGGGGGPRQELKTSQSENIHEDLFKGPAVRNFNFCRVFYAQNKLLFQMIILNNKGKFSVEESFTINN
jgi:predicted phosphodiesterase